MTAGIFADRFQQVFAGLFGDGLLEAGDGGFTIAAEAGRGGEFAFPKFFEQRFALEFAGVAGGCEAVGLPFDSRHANRGAHRRVERFAVCFYRDQLDRKLLPFDDNGIEALQAEVELGAMLDEGARRGNGLLVQVGDFAQELRRARLRRFRIHRKRGGDLRAAVVRNRDIALGVVLRNAIERAVEAEIVDRVVKGEGGEAFRRERIIARHERPGKLRFRERFPHEIFRGDGKRELRVADRFRRFRNRNFKRVRFVFLNLERDGAAESLAFLARGADAESTERSFWESDLFIEGAVVRKRDRLGEDFALFRIGKRERDLFTRGNRWLVGARIAGVAFEINFVARLVDAAFGEKENRVQRVIVGIRALFRDAEAIERKGIFAREK